MKRILTVQDISCVGKCSLTVALPVISAMGVEACPLPTAVLSTHTAFSSFSFCDLTDELPKICDQWHRQKIHFDAIYTGYLGSIEQINLVHKIFDDFADNDTLIVVDPCMADNGKLYSGFTKDFVNEMKSVCERANFILPNMTEACFLTGTEFIKGGYSQEYIQKIIDAFFSLDLNGSNDLNDSKNVILKGIEFAKKSKESETDENQKIGIAFGNSSDKKISYYFHHKFGQNFHGTGDIFASVVAAALVQGFEMQDAVKLAADFVEESIRCTLSHPDYNWYGVDFESAIPFLTRFSKKN